MKNKPIERLKYHVSGAIERGEKTAIEAVLPKHTPGPWRLQEPSKTKQKELALFRVLTPNGDEGISIAGTLANAHLIAAAPELLEACEIALKRLIELQISTGYPTAWPQIQLETVIKKAKGEL